MKHRFLYSLAAFAAGALLAACVQSGAGSQQEAPTTEAPSAATTSGGIPETLQIGVDANFPPMTFRDFRGDLIGHDIEMATEAAKRMNMEVRFKPVSWEEKEADLQEKRIDAIWSGLSITEDRKKTMAFSKPYMVNHQIIMVLAASPIRNKADLAGRVVGFQSGSTAEDALSADAALSDTVKEVRKFKDIDLTLKALQAGEIEAVVLDQTEGHYFGNAIPGKYRELPERLANEEYGIAVRKEDTALLAKLNETLDAMVADGTAKTIYAKWLSDQPQKQ